MGRTTAQFAVAGGRSVAERLRQRAEAFVRDYGCPEWFRPIHVRVLLALLDGPATSADLKRTAGKLQQNPYCGRQGRYDRAYRNFLAELCAAGFVSSFRLPRTGRLGSLPVRYMLTLTALNMIAAAEPAEESAP